MRLACPAVMNGFAALRPLPMSDRDKDVEILVLRHQLTVVQRQLGPSRPAFTGADRAFLAALPAPPPRAVLHRLQLLVRPDTVLRRHRDLMRSRHAKAGRPKRTGRPRTVRSIRVLVLRLVKENPRWGYRRTHRQLAVPGVKVAASTVREILRAAGVDPAPARAATTWPAFLRSQAGAVFACDFLETVTPTGQRRYAPAGIQPAPPPVPILGTTTPITS